MEHHPPPYYAIGSLVTLPSDRFNAEDVFKPNKHFFWLENDGRNGWHVIQHFGQVALPWKDAVLARRVLRGANILLRGSRSQMIQQIK